MYSSNRSIDTQSFEFQQHRHASCFNAEGQTISYPTSLTNRRKREEDAAIHYALMYRRSSPVSGRRWQDWEENVRGQTDAPRKTIAWNKVFFVFLVVSLTIGLGNSFQSGNVYLPRIASPDFARYQWVGYHRLSPPPSLPMELR
jgi:hypothetical protein